mmetsp:Transcript_1087/g.2255  ORF Transcript_1087/g.2255 Transcript_1087/m.2255 type:complete len:88 (-) Transcript_1087:176-439(-)
MGQTSSWRLTGTCLAMKAIKELVQLFRREDLAKSFHAPPIEEKICAEYQSQMSKWEIHFLFFSKNPTTTPNDRNSDGKSLFGMESIC